MAATNNPTTKRRRAKRRSVIDLSNAKARAFFLKGESYTTLALPPYFTFEGLLQNVAKVLRKNKLSTLRGSSPRGFDRVNFQIMTSKDGRYAWRPVELIHPALYVSLLNEITERSNWESICSAFSGYKSESRIKCLSIPVVPRADEKATAGQINQWWAEVEQQSIELSLQYEFLINTDIADCYPAIYTHSIAWALHTKPTAKARRWDMTLIGNIIDHHFQDMRQGQTNGIPQGSILMDFIAEMVLGYADTELAKKIESAEIEDYQILRYRDDYRIFVKSQPDGERILKCLTEVMIDLGLKLNPGKTTESDGVVRSSIKDDKLGWMFRKQRGRNPQEDLLIVQDHSITFPNSGSLNRALDSYARRLFRKKKLDRPMPLIAIVVDIAYRNPKTYPVTAVILSKLISFLTSSAEKRLVINRILKRFSRIPNTEHLEIWLQRISIPFTLRIDYPSSLCRLVSGKTEPIWNIDWISSTALKKAIGKTAIVDKATLDAMNPVIPIQEVEMFHLLYQ